VAHRVLAIGRQWSAPPHVVVWASLSLAQPSYIKPALKRLARLRRRRWHNRLSSAFHTGLVRLKLRRLKASFSDAQSGGGPFFGFKNQWSGDHLDFRASMLGQTTTGTVDVAEDHVRLEVQLPWLLSMLANKAKALVEKQGKLMLEKPVKPSTTRT